MASTARMGKHRDQGRRSLGMGHAAKLCREGIRPGPGWRAVLLLIVIRLFPWLCWQSIIRLRRLTLVGWCSYTDRCRNRIKQAW